MNQRWTVGSMAILLLLGQGCVAWRPVSTVSRPLPDRVRVVDATGEPTVVDDAGVQDSALVGTVSGSGERYRRALSDLTMVESRQVSVGATMFAIGYGAFLYVVYSLANALGSGT